MFNNHLSIPDLRITQTVVILIDWWDCCPPLYPLTLHVQPRPLLKAGPSVMAWPCATLNWYQDLRAYRVPFEHSFRCHSHSTYIPSPPSASPAPVQDGIRRAKSDASWDLASRHTSKKRTPRSGVCGTQEFKLWVMSQCSVMLCVLYFFLSRETPWVCVPFIGRPPIAPGWVDWSISRTFQGFVPPWDVCLYGTCGWPQAVQHTAGTQRSQCSVHTCRFATCRKPFLLYDQCRSGSVQSSILNLML